MSMDEMSPNILGERGMRYKRNTLAASLIATVLYLTNAPLGEVSLFGVSLSNVEDKEPAAWAIFLVILAYQWVMLIYYGWTDWRIWQSRIRHELHFSPWNIAAWMKKGAAMWAGGMKTEKTIFISKKTTGGLAWTAAARGSSKAGHTLLNNDREMVRWRLAAFLTIEFGAPFLWGAACLFLVLSKILD